MKFLLKKGKHNPIPYKFKFYAFSSNFNWLVKFNKECWYEKSDIKYTGYNKLRGVTFGIHAEKPFGKWFLTKWLVNSALIGWQPCFDDPYKKKINLCLYYDVNGVEHRELFKMVEVEEEFNIKYIIQKNGVIIKINDEKSFYIMPTKTWLRFGYHLCPYFGGRSISPCDMVIDIK